MGKRSDYYAERKIYYIYKGDRHIDLHHDKERYHWLNLLNVDAQLSELASYVHHKLQWSLAAEGKKLERDHTSFRLVFPFDVSADVALYTITMYSRTKLPDDILKSETLGIYGFELQPKRRYLKFV